MTLFSKFHQWLEKKWVPNLRLLARSKFRDRARHSRKTLGLAERVEVRLLLTSNINYTAPATGSNLTLQVVEIGGAANLQLFNSANSSVIQSVVLNQGCVVDIIGATSINNQLTVNFSYAGTGPAEPITVLFVGGNPASGITDKVTIAGSGNQYEPQSFSLNSNANLFVTGTMQTVGDINLTTTQQDTGSVVLAGIIQATASANITVDGGSLTGDNITLAAQSTINVNSQSAALFNGLIRNGAVKSNSGATIQVKSGNLTASGNLVLAATSTTTTGLTTAPAAAGTLGSDAAASTSTVASAASVGVSGGVLSATAGSATIAASNVINVTTTADGTAGSSAAGAKGGTVAVTVLSGDTNATVSGGTVKASHVNVSATSKRTITTMAKATQGGAAPGNPANTLGQQTLTNYGAATPDGKVNLAGAVAVTSVTGDTNARVIGGSTTATTNPLDVTASATDNPTTTANATTVTGAAGTGVGAAVAIGQTNGNNVASLGGTANVTAPTINVTSQMPASTFAVSATSGSGGATIGVAGSLAIDATNVNSNAQVEPASTVNVHGANLNLNAQSTTNSAATALPAVVAGKSVGIGASVAINVPRVGERAAVENGATLTGADALTLSAVGSHAATTTSLAGAAGGTATAGAVSLTIPSGATAAVIGTGPALTLGGALTVTTNRTSAISTQVDSAAATAGVAVGGSVGLTIAGESATSTVGRAVSTSATPALLHAEGHDTSNTTALASVSGAKPGSTAANTLLGNLASFAAGKSWTPTVVSLPTAATSDGKFGVAGAIAVNLAGIDANAAVLAGASLVVTGGPFTVQAITTYTDSAMADGTAVNTATGVAGAVAINRSTPSAEATIAGSVTANTVSDTANSSGQTDVTANSGNGSTNVGVAGALALNLPDASSLANVAASGNAVVTSTGSATVQATTTVKHDNATADGKATGFAQTGVGASAALDIPANGATAEVLGTVTSPTQATVSANGSFTGTATAAAGATGGTALAPALSLMIPTNKTLALIGPTGMVSAGGALLVQTTHTDNSTSRARADTAKTNAAVGAALSVGVGLDSDEAEVAGKVTHSAALSIQTNLGGASQSLATAGDNGTASGGSPINTIISKAVSFGQSSGWLPASLQIPIAQSADGQLQLAAAAAVNVDVTGSTATVASGGAVTTSAPLLVQTKSNVDASALADATGTASNVAAALAINVARPTVAASVAGAVTAPAVTIQTTMSNGGVNTDTATAKSGVGTTNTGVAGALTINLAANSSEAAIRDNAALTLSGGNVTVQATAVNAGASEALAKTPGGSVIGLGASVALGTALNSTHADIGAATITGAGNVSVTANGTNQPTATDPAQANAVAGVHLDTAAAAAATAILFSGNQTTAELLAGTTTLTLTGSLTVEATDTAPVVTDADATFVGNGAGAGMAIGIGINREVVTANESRNVKTGGSVQTVANTSSPTTTTSKASADGGKTIGQSLDALINAEISLIDPNAANPNSKVTVAGVSPTLTSIANSIGLAMPVLGAAATVSASASQPQTLAEIGKGTTITAGGVSVLTSVDTDATSSADGRAQKDAANAALAVAVNFAGGSNRATVNDNVTITAPTITVSAAVTNPLMFNVSADSGAGAVLAGAAGAFALNAGANTMKAQIGNGDNFTATGNVSITATSTLDSTTLAGGKVLGLAAGVGASVAASAVQDETDASIGNSQVNAGETIEVSSMATQNLSSAAVNGTGAWLAAVAGSVSVNSLVATTQAFTAPGAQLNQNIALNSAQNIVIQAVDDTTVMGGAGVSGAALLGSASASVDASAIQKDTLAYLGGKVDAGGNIFVTANSDEEAISMTGTLGLSVLTSLAGSGGIDHVDDTTKAYVDSGAKIVANGSVKIAADDHSESDITADANDFSATLGAAGAALAVGWNTKITEAYIAGADPTRSDPFNAGGTLGAANVQANAKLPAVTVNTGNFHISFVPVVSSPGKIAPYFGSIASGLSSVTSNSVLGAIGSLISKLLSLLTSVDGPPLDPALTKTRVSTPQTESLQGIAITATTRDDIADDAAGTTGTLAGVSIAPELSGSAALIDNQTSAFIAKGATATSLNSVLVTAGSDAYHLGIAGSQSVGLSSGVGVGASGNLSFISNTTEAYVAGQATANDNVEITAFGDEDALAFATGLSLQTGSYGANLTASFPLIAIDNVTHAFVDAGGFVHADGNVLITAQDETITNSLAGEAALNTTTGLGVGASAAVTLITKDTAAYIGQNATVHADGTTPDAVTAFSGTTNSTDSFPLGFATESIHGLAVQANSSEQVFDVAAAGKVAAGRQIQVTGSLDFYVTGSSTSAYIDTGATVTANQVNVSAVNDLKTWDAAVNLYFASGLSVAGGVDVGLDRNNTTATIGGNVTATGNVEVHALSRTLVDSFVGAAGLTGVGASLATSLSLISIVGNFAPVFGVNPLSFLNFTSGDVQGSLDSLISNFSSSAGGGITTLLGKYAQGVSFGNAAAKAVAAAAPTKPATDAVTQSLTGLGTQAHISGGSVTAGGHVDVSGLAVVDAHLDTSFTFNFDLGDGLNFALDAGFLTTGGVAGGFIDSGAQVTAAGGPVIVTGEVDNGNANNYQQVAASNAFDSTANQVHAVIRGINTRITPAITATGSQKVAIGDTTDIKVGTPLVVNAGLPDHETVTVTAVDSANGTITAVFANKHAAGATLTLAQQTMVKAPGGDVDLTATNSTFANYTALMPGLGTTLQTKVSDVSLASTIDAHITANAKVTGNNVNVIANDTGTVFALSIAMSLKKGGFGVGANLTTTEASDTVTAYTNNATVVAATGNIDLTATSVQSIESYGIGSAAALKGSFVGAGSYVAVSVENTIEAYATGGTLQAQGGVNITAGDSSGSNQTSITSLAGGVAASLGTASVGAAITNNTLENTIKSYISGATVTSTTGDVDVKANSKLNLTTLALAVSASQTFALGGSVTLNKVDDNVDAQIQGGATVTAHGSVNVTANDTPTLSIVAGTIAGSNSVGAAASVAINTIGDTVEANIDASKVQATTGNVQVLATDSANMTKLVVVGGGLASTVGVAGSVDVNDISNNVQASITSKSNVAAIDNVTVIAQTGTQLSPIVGSISIGGTAGVGGSVLLDQFSDKTQAFVSGNSTVSGQGAAPVTVPKADGSGNVQNASGVFVIALTNNKLTEVTINGAGAGTAAVAGTVDIDLIDDDTLAYIDGSTINPNNSSNNASQVVFVRAANSTVVNVNAGTGAVGGSAGVGATSVTTLIGNTTKAYIVDNANVNALNDVEVTANAQEQVNALVLSLGGSLAAGVAGQAFVVSMTSTTQAYIDGSIVTAANLHDVDLGSLKVLATTNDQLGTGGSVGAAIVGATGLGLGGGVGGSVIVATISPTTTAYINNATTAASRETDVEATSSEAEKTYDITAAGGAYLGVAGSVTVVTIKPNTDSFIEGTSHVNLNSAVFPTGVPRNVNVEATDSTTANDLAGAAAGSAVAGIGASIDVVTVRNTTVAYIGAGSSVFATQGNVQVLANETRNVNSAVLAFAGGIVGIQAGISVVNVGSGASETTVQQNVPIVTNITPAITAGGSQTLAFANAKNIHKGDSLVVNFGKSDQETITVTNVNGNNITATFAKSHAAGATLTEASAVAAATGTNANVNQQITGPGGTKVNNLPANQPNTPFTSFTTAAANTNSTINQTTAGMNVNDDFATAPVTTTGTSASIMGNVTAGGNISVLATDTSNVQSVSGGASGGLVSAGASIGVDNISPHTEAFIAGSGTISAGGTVAVNAKYVLNPSNEKVASVLAGGGGLVSVGGTVAVVTENSTQSAYVGGSANINQAQAVNIGAQSTRPLTILTGNVSLGGVAAGAAVAIVNAGGSTQADVQDSAQIGETGTVGSLSIVASPNTTVNVTAVAVSAGGIALAVNDAEAKIENQSVQANIAGSSKVKTTGDIIVEANPTEAATAQTDGVSVAAAVSVDVSSSTATMTPNVSAFIGGTANVNAGGNMTVESLNNVNANGTPIANQAKATSFASSGAIVAGITSGSATATASASLNTFVDTGATVQAGHTITITSLDNDQANSTLTGVSGGLVGVGVGVSSATTSGSTTADMKGTLQSAQLLTVNANSQDNATTNSFGLGGGVFIAGVVKGNATALPIVNALLDGGVTNAGQVTIQATANKATTASATGVHAGGVAVSAMNSTAHTGGQTTAQVNGTVRSGAVSVLANDQENANSHLIFGSVAAVGVTGAGSSADDSGTGQADISPSAKLTVTGAVIVGGKSTGTSGADGGGASVSLGNITSMSVSATNEDSTKSFAAGNITSGSLAITANSNQGANAKSDVTSIGLIGSGVDSKTNSNVGPANGAGGTVAAFVGTPSGTAPSGTPTTLHITNALTVQANSQTNVASTLSVGSGGLINGTSAQAAATTNETTLAYLGDGTALGNGVVVTAGNVQVTANATDVATGNTNISGGGLGNIQQDATDATVNPTVGAYFGQFVSAKVTNNVDIEATSNDAEGHATANFAGGGALQHGIADANAVDTPTVNGSINRGSNVTAGGNVTVDGSALTQGQPNSKQISSVQTNNNSITDPSLSGVKTGDPVVYDYGSSTSPIQSGATGSALQDDRSFQAIVTGTNTVQLGSTFSALNAKGVIIQFSTPDAFQTGDQVQYDDMGNIPVGGLTQGATYFVTVLTPTTIELYSSAFDTPYSFVPSSGITISKVLNVIVSTTLQNANDAFTNNEAITYEAPTGEPNIGLQDATGKSTGQLQNGKTYYVVDATSTAFQIAATPKGTPLLLDPTTTSGNHQFIPNGITLSPSSGTQNLHLAFSSAGTRGDIIQPGTLFVPSGGTGQSTSNASGGAGGAVVVSAPTATTTSNPIVHAFIAAQTVTAGGNVTIASEAIGSTSSNANNSAGGFVAIGTVNETTNFTSSSQAFAGTMTNGAVDGSGVTINAHGNLTLSSDTQLTTNVSGRVVNAGGVSTTHNNATANATSTTNSIVGNNAQLTASTISLVATGSKFSDNISPRAITAAIAGSATANANSNINSTAKVLIGGGTTLVEGDQGVDVRATNKSFNQSLNADASNYSIGPSGHSHNNPNNHFQTFIESDAGATIVAGPRSAAPPLVAVPGFPNLALYVDAEDTGVSNASEDRNIVWNGNVTIKQSVNPNLFINSSGVITTDNNVTVTDGEGGPIRTIGQSITSGTAVVTNINDNVAQGQIYFVGEGGNKDGVENGNNSASPSGPSYPLFTFNYAFSNVTIINQSSNNLDIHQINVINPNVPLVQIDSPNYPSNAPSYPPNNVPFGFHIALVPPTSIDIENQQNATGNQKPSNINLTDAIQNPVGSTVIKNQRGSINATSANAVVWTNAMDIEASGGVGTTAPIGLELIEAAGAPAGTVRPIQLTAIATTGDLDLAITARRRDGNTGNLVANIQKMSAGGSINVTLGGSMQDPSAAAAHELIVTIQKYQTTQLDSHQYESFFYPDSTSPGTDDAAFVNLAAAKTIATTQYQFGSSSPGLAAGDNIVVTADSVPTDPIINITGTTDLTNSFGFGYIDTITNGSINETETGGKMRIGSVSSTNSNVVLANPVGDLGVVANNFNNGLVSAKTTVVLNVSGNLSTAGNTSPSRSMLTAGTSITINPTSASYLDINGSIASPITQITSGYFIDFFYPHGINSAATSVTTATQLNTAVVDVNGGGASSLTLDDYSSAQADSGVMTGSEINGLGMGGYGIHYVNIQRNLEIDLSRNGGSNTFTVLATACPTMVVGGWGADSLVVGSAIATATTVNEDTALNGADSSIPAGGVVPADDGDLNRIRGALTFIGNGGQDSVEVNDLYSADGQAATPKLDPDFGYDYLVTPTAVQNDPTSITSPVSHTPPPRTFAGIIYNDTGIAEEDTVTFLRLDGTNLTNLFTVTPSVLTTYLINGELPVSPSTRNDGGDSLVLNTSQLDAPQGKSLTLYTTPNSFSDLPNDPTVRAQDAAELASTSGNGFWSFANFINKDAQPVYFLSIEQKENTTVQVRDSGGIYDSFPYPARATAFGADGTELSGTFSYIYTDSEGNSSSTAPSDAGNYQVTATFTSSNSNYSNGSATTSFTISPASPSVTISSSEPDGDEGDRVTLTAIVQAPIFGTPRGTVTFYLDEFTPIGTATLQTINGQQVATLYYYLPDPGDYTISPYYVSSNNNFTTVFGNPITEVVEEDVK